MTTQCGSEDEVVALLAAAFPLVRYTAGPFGVGGTSYPDAAVLEDALRNETWSSVDAQILEGHSESLHFIHPDRFAEVLPAYLYPLVVNAGTSHRLRSSVLVSLTRDHSEPQQAQDFDARTRGLDAAQREVISAVLQYVAEDIRTAGEAEWNYVDSRDNEAARALKSHWHR